MEPPKLQCEVLFMEWTLCPGPFQLGLRLLSFDFQVLVKSGCKCQPNLAMQILLFSSIVSISFDASNDYILKIKCNILWYQKLRLFMCI